MPNWKGYIRSSEVGEFVFCRRAWMLKEQNVAVSPEAQRQREEGVQYHTQHGRTLKKTATLRWAGIVLILLACAFGLIYLLRNVIDQ